MISSEKLIPVPMVMFGSKARLDKGKAPTNGVVAPKGFGGQ